MRENQNNCIHKIFSLSDQLLWVVIYICFIILILMLLIDYGCYKLCNIRLLLFERNSRSYNYTGAFWREIKAYGGYRNMKGCILGANFEEQGWLSRMFTILLILTWKLRYPQKRRADRKKGEREIWKLFCLAGEANDVPWGRKDLLGGPEAGKTILINYIMNFIQDSCQRFSHFKSTFLWLIQVYCITQKMQVSQNLAFLSTALQCHETELFCTFPAKNLYPLEKSSPSNCTFSRLQLLAWKLTKFLVIFLTISQSFFKYCITLQCHDT